MVSPCREKETRLPFSLPGWLSGSIKGAAAPASQHLLLCKM